MIVFCSPIEPRVACPLHTHTHIRDFVITLRFAMASASELQARAQQLRLQARQLNHAVRDLLRSSEAEGPRKATAWMQAVASRIFAQTQPHATAALDYLRLKGRRAEEGEVRGWFMALSQTDREGLLQEGEGRSAKNRQLAEANKFMAERSLVGWIKEQNTKKAIAPTPGAVLGKAAAVTTAASQRGSQYRRIRRIVDRWGGRKGRFSGGSQITREVLDHKATSSVQFGTVPEWFMCCHFAELLWGVFFGPDSGLVC